MTLLLLSVLGVLLASFCCSLMEAVLLSVTPVYVEVLLRRGYVSGRRLKTLKQDPGRPLGAILAFNTIANVMGSAFIGIQVLELFGHRWVAACSAALTLLILVLAEFLPKIIGARYWRQLAPVSAHVLRAWVWMLYPFVRVSQILSRRLAPHDRRSRLTREELIATTEIGKMDGALRDKEAHRIQNLLGLSQISVRDVFTPRARLLAFPAGKTVGEIVRENNPIRFSRIPVFGRDLDDITGFVLRQQLLRASVEGRTQATAGVLAEPLHAVPLSASVGTVLDAFIHRREHIFLVVDEYGGTAGIITLEDALETLLGSEIADEGDRQEEQRGGADSLSRPPR